MSEPKFTIGARNRLLISFSGGKTSARMAQILTSEYRHVWPEVIVAFMNTGWEHEKTLEYVDKCDRQYGLGVVWIEAEVNPEIGIGTGHRIVTFETASRHGEPFERVIEKYGIPNNQYPHCTRETKQVPLTSYLRSVGWGANSYNTAIGIRADEMDRISPKWIREAGAIYPLIDLGIRKDDVLAWELTQPVRLGIPEHWGNCTWCWKKSFRKLATVAREIPGVFDFAARMEAAHKDSGRGDGDRRFFRGRKTTADILAMAADPALEPFVDGFPFKDEALDLGAACGESCEIGVDGAEENRADCDHDWQIFSPIDTLETCTKCGATQPA